MGRSGYFSLNLSANSVMRGRLDARRTLKSLVADLREYKMMLEYKGKMFRVTIEYPFCYLSEKGVRALGSLNISSRKNLARNRSLIMNYMS
ncbi:hypothetical protein DW984_17005 [Parabacteroides distasonis]|nr:hypothetical protein DW984_17005 [Parabacteroides distasonis]